MNFGVNSEAVQILSEALSGIAAETAAIWDDEQTGLTTGHLETIKLVNDTLKSCPGGPLLKEHTANSDNLTIYDTIFSINF